MGDDGRFKAKHSLPTTGTVYGELRVVHVLRKQVTGGLIGIECQCSCGHVSIVNWSNLRSGKSTRCNTCARKASGVSGTRYDIGCPDKRHRRRLLGRMSAAISRCTNTGHRQFEAYGGRGIKVFEPWLKDKNLWLHHLCSLPGWDDPVATIDRRDNDKGYEPGNLRFVTHRKQQNNKRQTVWVEYDGQKMSAAEFHRRHAQNFAYAHTVIRKLRDGVSPEQVVKESQARSVRRYKLRPKKQICDSDI